MNEEEKKKYDDAIKAQEESATAQKEAEDALTAEKTGREEDKTTHEKAIAEKDVVITQKTEDAIGSRRKYKKLKDMTDEEKEAMTEKELQLQEQQEAQDAKQVEIEKQIKENGEKETKGRRDSAIKALGGDDEELIKKISDNYDNLKSGESATTEIEIGDVAKQAFEMLGVPAPDGVGGAIGDGGDGGVGKSQGTGFAESTRGQELAKNLGLGDVVTIPKDEGNK